MTAGPIGLSSRLLKLALVAVAAIAVLLSAAASAGADASASVSFHGHLRGKAFFDGSDFKVCDERKDNLPVAVRYSYIQRGGKPVRGTQWHTAGVEGAGKPRIPGQFVFGCSYATVRFIGTGQPVWVQACVRHENRSLQCGKVNKTRAT